MILFSFKEISEKLSTTVDSFLRVYGGNPIVWTLMFAVIIVVSYWAISSLGDKQINIKSAIAALNIADF